MKTLTKLKYIFDRQLKIKLALLLVAIIIGALLEVLALSIISPFISCIVELAAKIGLAFIFSSYFGYIGLWFVAPIGWILGTIPPVIRFHAGSMWKQRNDIDPVVR